MSVEYADVARRGGEHLRTLAAAFGVSEVRAAELLADPAQYRAAYRARHPLTVAEARRQLERRYPSVLLS